MHSFPERAKILDWVNTHRDDLNGAPAFVYFTEIVDRRLEQLRSALGPRIEIFYSVKANPHEALLRHFNAKGVKLDISSGGELAAAFRSGFGGEDLSFVGPGKTGAELELALQRQVGTIVVESLSEIARVNAAAEAVNFSPALSLRLHPRSYVSPSGRIKEREPSPFGLSEDQLPEALNLLSRLPRCRLEGIHLHIGSMFLNTAFIVENFRRALALAQEVKQRCPTLAHVNLGGGFGIPYRDSAVELDLPSLQRCTEQLLAEPLSRGMSLRVEAGRYLVGPAGCYVTRVLDRKESFGRTYLVVEGGINHHLAATGYGQVLRAPFPMAGIPTDRSAKSETISVVGSSCYSMDVLAEEVELPHLAIGDSLVIFQSGAYGPSFSPANFLSRPVAREIVV